MAQRYLQTNVKNYQDSIGSHFYSKQIKFKAWGNDSPHSPSVPKANAFSAHQAVPPQPPASNT
ncbi:hypothetical protein SynMVIR181_02989 [Synechococcus sp. MVIR-18-1]|nr:hypothetical protein SynMVIR181_02989 [Synechococcus sp. MVIR-18-1]